MSAPVIVSLVGVPGSSKTTFARQLAQSLDGVVLSSDAVRLSMYKSREAADAHRTNSEERRFSNQLVFGALTYATQQIAKAGHSVIFDAISSRRSERQEKRDLAEKLGVIVVVVRIQVPYEVLLRRIQERESLDDQRQFSQEKAKGVLEYFGSEIEEPAEDENVIYIDGEAPFEVQYETFKQCIATLI